MSSISLIRRSGDNQIYADIQDDGRRDAWYQPVSPEAIKALGLSDKNVQFRGNVNSSLIRKNVLTAESIKSLASEMLNSAKSNNTGVGNLQELVSGNPSTAFGTHETNFDPVSAAQKAKDDAVKGQMQKQNADQIAASTKADAETAAKNAEVAKWSLSSDGQILDENNPLVKKYRAAFPDVTLEAALGSVGNYIAAKQSGLTPAVDIENLNPQAPNVSPITGKQYEGPADLNYKVPGSGQAPGQTPEMPGQESPGTEGQQPPAPGISSPGQQGSSPADGQADFVGFSDLPDSVKNADWWKMMTKDQQSAAYFQYKMLTAQSEAQKKDMAKALDEAIAKADPYFKEQLRMIQDETNRSVVSTTEDAKSKMKSLEERVKAIKEDLTYNKEQLSIEQQSELAKQLRDNQQQIFDLGQNMADAGLIYSSPRQLAEKNLLTEQQGINESTNRRYAREARTQDVNAQRSLADLSQQQVDTERQRQEQLTKIQRASEANVGSKNAAKITGIDELGGITGKLDEEKQRQVLELQNIITKKQDPLTSLFNQS